MKVYFILLFCLISMAAFPQLKTDSEKITETALNYMEGWYNGDTLRMEKALHPDLVKSTPVWVEKTKGTVINTLSKSYLIETTKMWLGKKPGGEIPKIEVKILDMYDNIATVKVSSQDFTDYLHLTRSKGQW